MEQPNRLSFAPTHLCKRFHLQHTQSPSDTEMDYYVGEYVAGTARIAISKSKAPLPNGKSQAILILNFGGSNVLLRDSGLPESNSSSLKTLAVYIPEELVGCMRFELSAFDSQYVTFGTASAEPSASKTMLDT